MKVKLPPQCEDLAPHRKSMLANLPLAGDPFARPKKQHDSQTIFPDNNYLHDDSLPEQLILPLTDDKQLIQTGGFFLPGPAAVSFTFDDGDDFGKG